MERFIPGREFAVGLLGNNPVEAFPVVEIDLDNDPNAIQTLENKKHSPRRKICPADLPNEVAAEIQRLSIEAFKALQLKDFARVDIRVTAEGEINVLEVNSMASLGPNGSYPHAASVAGYDYTALVNRMLDVAVLRYYTATEFASNGSAHEQKIPLPVRIRSFLRGREQTIEALLKYMVNTNSYVRNVEGVNRLSNLLKKELSQLGFAHEAYPQLEVGNILYFTNTDDGSCDTLLLANLDNGTPPSEHEYFQVSEQRLLGTGIWENKGGLAVMVAALRALRFARLLRKLSIGILLTSDDALQGKFAREIISRKSLAAKYVLGLHGAFLDGGIVTSRSGAGSYQCHVRAVNIDDAAAVAAATSLFTRMISAWADLSEPEHGLVITPSALTMESNITDPYVHATTQLSIRFNDSAQMDCIDTRLRKLLPRPKRKQLQIEFEGGMRRPPMVKTERVLGLWQLVSRIAGTLDISMREEPRWSSADICFADASRYLIDGLGAVGAKPEKKTEFILRHSLLERSALLAILLSELKGQDL